MIAVTPVYIKAINRSLLKLQLLRGELKRSELKILSTQELLIIRKNKESIQRRLLLNAESKYRFSQLKYEAEKKAALEQKKLEKRKAFLVGSAFGAVVVLLISVLL